MSVAFFDSPSIHFGLLPLTYTRPACRLRIGVLTIEEKWVGLLGPVVGYYAGASYLNKKYPSPISIANWVIAGSLLPNEDLLEEIKALKPGQVLADNGQFLAANTIDPAYWEQCERLAAQSSYVQLHHTWDLFLHNGQEIRHDVDRLTNGRKSEPLPDPYTTVYAKENLFIEAGVRIKAAVLNAEDGPIYLGKNSQVMEGALIRGPFALGEGSQVSMGAKIRGDTTIGPHCRAGGEITNSIMIGYSNKGHEGYLGNAVLGEWCNLGADTNNSNLKNNYAEVKMWDYASRHFVPTGLQFCGLIMGDYSKCSINTMFNTGTTVGVFANIFGTGFPRNLIPSFGWGGESGFSTYRISKALETAERVLERKGQQLTEVDRELLTSVFQITADERPWEN